MIIKFSTESKVYANRKKPMGYIVLLIFANIKVQYLNHRNIAIIPRMEPFKEKIKESVAEAKTRFLVLKSSK